MKYVLNMELKKLVLESTKQEYQALTEEQKKAIKSNFLFSRSSGGWVSRAKWPNTRYAETVLQGMGVENGGKVGDMLSFSEQMEQKAARAERRADRMEYRAEKAVKEGERLQAPINSMHGDIAFFTQPNINTSAGRAFTRRRNAMFEAYDKGFEYFKKSGYYQDRAEAARATYKTATSPDRAFCQRRIEDAQKTIRAQKRNIAKWESYLKAIEAGETPKDAYGWEVKYSAEKIAEHIENCEILLTEAIEKEIYYREIQEEKGGVQFSRENVKPGYVVLMKRWGPAEVVSTGPKNFKYKTAYSSVVLSESYAVIEKILKAEEKKVPVHPFRVGDKFTVELWIDRDYKKVPVEIVKATGKSITILNTITGKKTVRQPKIHEDYTGLRWWEVWMDDNYHSRFTKPYEAAKA